MRFVTWNCRIGRFRDKAKLIAQLSPHLLAVQEIEPFDQSTVFTGLNPKCRDHCAAEGFPRRGLGMFSFGEMTISPLDESASFSGVRRYEASWRDRVINVMGAWPWATKSVATSYRQLHEGLLAHKDWISQRETIVLGDFNASAAFTERRNVRNWNDLAALMESIGLVSAYHSFRSEPPGSESSPTYFHRGHENAPFHLDYCFVPTAWLPRIRSVDVGRYADWRAASDHMPLTVDVDL